MSAIGWAVSCYIVALITDTVGIVALVKAGFDARRAIQAIDSHPGIVEPGDGTFQITDRDDEVRSALGNQRIIWWSLAALIIGIVVGFAGNMISTLGP